MKLTMPGSDNLVYVTEVADDLRDQATILLGQIASRSPELDLDAPARLDWGVVKLERQGNEVWVNEPDYRHDPRRYIPGMNFTCAVVRAQQCTHDRLGVSAEPVRYDQSILIYPRALSERPIAAIRQKGETPRDSGWRVFAVEQIDWALEPRACYVYQLAVKRAALLAALSLPVGWSVQLEGETLKQAAAPDGSAFVVDLPIEL
jgi:hypothetical protein